MPAGAPQVLCYAESGEMGRFSLIRRDRPDRKAESGPRTEPLYYLPVS